MRRIPTVSEDSGAPVSIDRLTVRYGTVTAVDGVSLSIRPGEFFALLGPSGSGKTSLLRALAGLEDPIAGRVAIDGIDMTDVPAHRRPVNMVFQSYALFPHLDVAGNVAYGLRKAGLSKADRQARVADALALVELGSLGSRRIDQLSGGQRQRVALARALVKRPRVLLLDEPLAALDRRLRAQMQVDLRALQHRVGTTFLMVTHDQDEAMSLADRVAVMFDGRVAQVAQPAALYARPATRQVADFIGNINLFEAEVIEAAPEVVAVKAGGLGLLRVPRPDFVVNNGDAVLLAVRPEQIGVLPAGSPLAEGGVADGEVHAVAFHGRSRLVHVTVPGRTGIMAMLPGTVAEDLTAGTPVRLHVPSGNGWLVPG